MSVNPQQFLATDPQSSCWVMASAGTGKTKMLIDRLLRLLLSNADPKRIICITYTKAAANEMAERLQHIVLQWSKLGEDALVSTLMQLEQKEPSPQQIILARSLFHTLLERPLTIQTIHSFCQRILSQFPFEANLQPDFQMMDESDAELLRERCIRHVLTCAEYQDILAIIGQSMSEYYLKECLDEALSKRTKIGSKAAQHRRAYFKDAPKVTLTDHNFDSIQRIAQLMVEFGPKNLKVKAAKVLSDTSCEEALFALFLTAEGVPRAKPSTKELLKEYPDFLVLFNETAHIIEQLLDQRETEKALALNEAFDEVFDAINAHYALEKNRQNTLDFDDLIVKTSALLLSDYAWVMHKLDGGFDHLLIDEAQDTSPDQWDIIKALTTHFFDEPATNQCQRTLFVVGDAKQSIYSFQGADPKAYLSIKHYFEDLLRNAGHTLKTINLDTCYRCAPEILSIVDQVCNHTRVTPSLLHKDTIAHIPHRTKDVGHAVAWPLIAETQPSNKSESTSWQLFPMPVLVESAEDRLAENITRRIHHLLRSPLILPSTGLPVQPSDIYILLRRRGKLMAILSKALTAREIPNTCQDQSAFLEHLYVKDFLAFLSFLDCPYDDLTLATLLKSPLFGVSEEDLIRLCHKRTQPLLSVIQKDPKLKDHGNFLKYFILHYTKDDLYTLAHTYLHTTFTRNQKYFGSAVAIHFESLLALVLQAQQKGITMALDARHYIENHAADLKNSNAEGIQLMTIHGSKGLQAPIVILGDTGDTPVSTHNRIIFTANFHILRQQSGILKSIKSLENKTLEAENHRLMYVALTRAQDQLYIAGIDQDNEDCWYNVLAPFMTLDENPVEAAFIDGPPSIETREASSRKRTRSKNFPSIKKQKTTDASEKGVKIHKILELLSTLNSDDASVSHLNHPYFKGLTEEDFEDLIALYRNTLKPILADTTVFHELPLKARDGNVYRLDCVAFSENKIMIIDFKTGTKTERTMKKNQEQIETYAAILRAIYPGHIIEGILLYTQSKEIVRWLGKRDEKNKMSA